MDHARFPRLLRAIYDAVDALQEMFLGVSRLQRDGNFSEEYNGPGAPVWSSVRHKPRPKNGQYQVSLAALRRIMKTIPAAERLERKAAGTHEVV